MDLSVSTLALESFLLVLVRTGCFVSIAPIFGHKSINARLKVLIAACIALAIFSAVDISQPVYDSVWGYSILVIKEAAVGLSMGFISSFVMSILVMTGEFIDREIGFTMATTFDMNTGAMVTITAELYDKLVYVVILITNLHYYILKAIAESFVLVPVGEVGLNLPILHGSVIDFFTQYFSIGFRIAMPIFLGATILNVVLGILAKSSPQMNMFAVGIQLKVIIGLIVLSIIIMFIPNITNYLMERMQDMVYTIMGGF